MTSLMLLISAYTLYFFASIHMYKRFYPYAIISSLKNIKMKEPKNVRIQKENNRKHKDFRFEIFEKFEKYKRIIKK